MPTDLLTLMLTLLPYGCPTAAIVATFGFQTRTIRRWQRITGAGTARTNRATLWFLIQPHVVALRDDPHLAQRRCSLIIRKVQQHLLSLLQLKIDLIRLRN